MKLLVLNNRRGFLMAIAIYQVLGGIAGVFLVFNLITPETNPGFYIAIIPIAALILISLFAGIFYFFKGECAQFFLLSKLNFCAQMIQLAIVAIKFYFYYGFHFAVGIDEEHILVVSTGVQVMDFSLIFGKPDYLFFKVNLLPLIPLAILRWAERNPVKGPEETFLMEEEPLQ